MWEIFKEVLLETMMFYFIWLGLPVLLYGIAFVVINIPTIKARRGERKPSIEIDPPRRKTIVFPDGHEETEGKMWVE